MGYFLLNIGYVAEIKNLTLHFTASIQWYNLQWGFIGSCYKNPTYHRNKLQKPNILFKNAWLWQFDGI